MVVVIAFVVSGDCVRLMVCVVFILVFVFAVLIVFVVFRVLVLFAIFIVVLVAFVVLFIDTAWQPAALFAQVFGVMFCFLLDFVPVVR